MIGTSFPIALSVGCASSVASGGDCGPAAFAQGVTAAVGPKLVTAGYYGGLAASVTIGGTASVLGGGKFWNGASTSAFAYMFNDALADAQQAEALKAGLYAQYDRGPDILGPMFKAWTWVMSGVGFVPEFAAEFAAEEVTTTVGRWMSQSELDAMQATGRVQESIGHNGVTSVTVPPNPNLYRAAPSNDVFVQFDVPSSSLNGVGTGTAKIYGPNSIFGPKLNVTEMPPATNIKGPQ